MDGLLLEQARVQIAGEVPHFHGSKLLHPLLPAHDDNVLLLQNPGKDRWVPGRGAAGDEHLIASDRESDDPPRYYYWYLKRKCDKVGRLKDLGSHQ